MPIRDLPHRPAARAALSLTLALGVGCAGETNPNYDYVTFQVGPGETFDVRWRAEPVGALDPPCFGFETDLISNAVFRGEGTDQEEQESNTYFRYVGNEDGEAADGCSGAFEAQFTYDGSRFLLSGTITRPFPDIAEVDETDAEPHATGTFVVEPSGVTGDFLFWAFEYHGAAAPRGYPTEPLTR